MQTSRKPGLKIIDRHPEDGVSVIMNSHVRDHTFFLSDKIAIMQHGTFRTYDPRPGRSSPKTIFNKEIWEQ